MKKNHITLNISEHTMDAEKWNILDHIYKTSDGWVGYSKDSIPYWFSMNEKKKYICASAEMHGLVFDVFMKEEKWNNWIEEFINYSSKMLGFKVVDMEE